MHPQDLATTDDMAELSQNAILRITEDKTLELIELYRQESCLWDTRSPHYKHRHMRARAADRIARKLDVPHFEARHVLIKFKNLRNAYSQDLKKIARSIEAGEEVHKPTVIWFNMMDSFLRPHLQPARRRKKQPMSKSKGAQEDLNIKIEPETLYLEVEDNHAEGMQAEHEVLLKPAYSVDSHKDQEFHIERSESDGYLCESRSNTSRKRRYSSHNYFQSSRQDFNEQTVQLSQTLKHISDYLQRLSSNTEDHYDTFGKYVAALLRSLSPRVAMELQPKIISLFVGAGVGKGDKDNLGREVGGGS